MSSQTITRGTALAAAALLLGGAFMVGATYSAHQANAAPAVPTPTPAVSVGGPTAGITVTGTADVAGTPDTLRLDLAVTARADTVNKALDQANSAAKKVQGAAFGLERVEAQTSADHKAQVQILKPVILVIVEDVHEQTARQIVVVRNAASNGLSCAVVLSVCQ